MLHVRVKRHSVTWVLSRLGSVWWANKWALETAVPILEELECVLWPCEMMRSWKINQLRKRKKKSDHVTMGPNLQEDPIAVIQKDTGKGCSLTPPNPATVLLTRYLDLWALPGFVLIWDTFLTQGTMTIPPKVTRTLEAERGENTALSHQELRGVAQKSKLCMFSQLLQVNRQDLCNVS